MVGRGSADYGERFAVRKRVKGKFRIALVYPNSYRVAISNLGFRTVYHLLNLDDRVYCERFTSDDERSIETRSKLRDFDLILFCYQYEPDLFEIAKIISRFKLFDKPKLIGGPCTCNPFPLKGMIDYVYLGEAEAGLMEFVDAAIRDLDEGRFTQLEGMLDFNSPRRVRRVYPRCLDTFLPSLQVSSRLSVFGDALLVDVSRGCSWACSFCLGRRVYAPYRERSLDQLIRVIEDGVLRGGYEAVALIAGDLNSYGRLDELVEFLRRLRRVRRFRIIAPSLRADTLNEDLVKLLVESGERTVALAPESSEELRFRIGKPFTDETLLKACKLLKDLGIKRLKLYFMFGLPGETMKDLESIVNLVKRIAEMRFVVRVSANPFVPKPHTPMEDAELQDLRELRRKLRFLRRMLGGMLTTDGIRQAYLQAMIGRGDEAIGRLIMEAAKQGDKPYMSLLKRKARQLGINLDEYAKQGSEEKPWKRIQLS